MPAQVGERKHGSFPGMDLQRETLSWCDGWLLGPPAAAQPPETPCKPGFRLGRTPGTIAPNTAAPGWSLEIEGLAGAAVLAHGLAGIDASGGICHHLHCPLPGTLCGETAHATGLHLLSQRHEIRRDGAQTVLAAPGLCVVLIVERHATGTRWALVWSEGNEHETTVHAKAALAVGARAEWDRLLAHRRRILSRAPVDEAFRPCVLEAVEILLGALRPAEGTFPGPWLDTRNQSPAMELSRAIAVLPALLRLEPDLAGALLDTILQLQEPDHSLPSAVAPNESSGPRHAPLPLLASAALALWRQTGELDFARRIVPQLVPVLARQLDHFQSSKDGVSCWQNAGESITPQIHDSGLATPDVASLLLAELQALRELASPFPDHAQRVAPLLARRERLEASLQEFFWDGRKMEFRSRYLDGRVIARPTVAGALPLLSASLPPGQAGQILRLIGPGGPLRLPFGVANWAKWENDDAAPAASPLVQILLLRALRSRGLDAESEALARDLVAHLQDARRRLGRLPDELSETPEAPGLPLETAALVVHLAFGDELAGNAVRRRVSPVLAWLDRQRNGLAAAAVIAALGAGALVAVPSLLSRHADPPPETRLGIGQLRYDEGDFRGALLIYGELLGTPLRDAQALDFKTGNAWFRLGAWSQAEAAYRTALERNPDQPRAWMNLALTLYQQGKFADAKKVYADFITTFGSYYPELEARARTAGELCDLRMARP